MGTTESKFSLNVIHYAKNHNIDLETEDGIIQLIKWDCHMIKYIINPTKAMIYGFAQYSFSSIELLLKFHPNIIIDRDIVKIFFKNVYCTSIKYLCMLDNNDLITVLQHNHNIINHIKPTDTLLDIAFDTSIKNNSPLCLLDKYTNLTADIVEKTVNYIPTQKCYTMIPKNMITDEIIHIFISRNPMSISFIDANLLTNIHYQKAFELNRNTIQYIPSQYHTQSMADLSPIKNLRYFDKKFFLHRIIPTDTEDYIKLIPSENQTVQMCCRSIFQYNKFNYANLQWCTKLDAELLDDIYKLIPGRKYKRMNFINEFSEAQIINILSISPEFIVNVPKKYSYVMTTLRANPRMLKYVIDRYKYYDDYIKLAISGIRHAYLFNAWSRVLLRIYPSKTKELFYILTKEHTVILALLEYLVGDIVGAILKLYFNDKRCSNRTVNRLLSVVLNKNIYCISKN